MHSQVDNESGGYSQTRALNMRAVYSYIQKSKTTTRQSLARQLSLSLSSITRLVASLTESGFIREGAAYSDGPGRKTTTLEVNPQAGYTFGIHIDKDYIKIGIVDFAQKILCSQRVAMDCAQRPAKKVLEDAGALLRQMAAEIDIPCHKVAGAGIALPGIVDTDAGILIFSPQLGWEGLPLQNMAQDILGIPAVVDNDVKLFAYGETASGIAGNPASAVFLYIGSGVGTAFVQDGRVFKGSMNSAGEIGHAKIDTGGILCDCGRMGCLQTHMTEWAIVKKAQDIDPAISSSKEIFAYMSQGYSWAAAIINDLVNYSAITLGLLSTVYDPQVIILCGELIAHNEIVFQRIVNRYTDTQYAPVSEGCRIIQSGLLHDGVFFGAALSSADRIISRCDFRSTVVD